MPSYGTDLGLAPDNDCLDLDCDGCTTLKDIHLKIPSNIGDKSTTRANTDTIEITSTTSNNLTDTTLQSATACNESGVCVASNKGSGGGSIEKTYSIWGKIHVDQSITQNESSGQRMCEDAKYYQTTESMNLNAFGTGSDSCIEVVDDDGVKPTSIVQKPAYPPPVNPPTYEPRTHETKTYGANPYEPPTYEVKTYPPKELYTDKPMTAVQDNTDYDNTVQDNSVPEKPYVKPAPETTSYTGNQRPYQMHY